MISRVCGPAVQFVGSVLAQTYVVFVPAVVPVVGRLERLVI